MNTVYENLFKCWETSVELNAKGRCGTVISELNYYGKAKKKNSHIVLILNPDIIKDLRSYALADYSNEEPMELSYTRYGV